MTAILIMDVIYTQFWGEMWIRVFLDYFRRVWCGWWFLSNWRLCTVHPGYQVVRYSKRSPFESICNFDVNSKICNGNPSRVFHSFVRTTHDSWTHFAPNSGFFARFTGGGPSVSGYGKTTPTGGRVSVADMFPWLSLCFPGICCWWWTEAGTACWYLAGPAAGKIFPVGVNGVLGGRGGGPDDTGCLACRSSVTVETGRVRLVRVGGGVTEMRGAWVCS